MDQCILIVARQHRLDDDDDALILRTPLNG